MGNRLCKRKTDVVDNVPQRSSNEKTSTFDRIISRLHLRPTAWKSESHLNQKQVNRSEANSKDPTRDQGPKPTIVHTKPMSKSSDWTEVELQVPDQEPVHLRNPKLDVIFNNTEGTPTPPPRKHKKGFREKIEAVAKSSLQAFQSKKPVEEEVCVKKRIDFGCPYCDGDENAHNRDHKHHHEHKKPKTDNLQTLEGLIINNNSIEAHKKGDKDLKRRKNLSVVSLPNYSDLKLTVANFEDIDQKPVDSKRNSITSLNEPKKIPTNTGKLDNYITRCRSFGSLIPQQIMGKLKSRKVPADIESDDSFGALEDWDLRIIEHYNPKEASLPRVRKLPQKTVLSDIESLVVQEEESKPSPPIRRAESNKKTTLKQTNHAPNTQIKNKTVENPKLVKEHVEERLHEVPLEAAQDHSSLMKILEQYSVNKAQDPIDIPSTLDLSTIPHIDDDNTSDFIRHSEAKQLSPSVEKAAQGIGAFLQAEENDTLARYHNGLGKNSAKI